MLIYRVITVLAVCSFATDVIAQSQERPVAAFARLGWTAPQIAASGFTGADVTVIRTRLEEAAEPYAEWRLAAEAASTAIRDAAAARAALAQDPSNPALQSQSAAAQTAAESAVADELLKRRILTALLLDGFGGKATVLERTTAPAARAVPVELAVVERTSEAWLSLRNALTEEERCLRRRIPVPWESSALLATERSQPDVVEARLRMQSNLQAVREVLTTP